MQRSKSFINRRGTPLSTKPRSKSVSSMRGSFEGVAKNRMFFMSQIDGSVTMYLFSLSSIYEYISKDLISGEVLCNFFSDIIGRNDHIAFNFRKEEFIAEIFGSTNSKESVNKKYVEKEKQKFYVLLDFFIWLI